MAELAIWCGACLVCFAGAAFYFGIDRWWWNGVDRPQSRRWFRGYILGTACQLGLVAFWAAFAATPDSNLGITLLFGTAVCVIVAAGTRQLLQRVRARRLPDARAV